MFRIRTYDTEPPMNTSDLRAIDKNAVMHREFRPQTRNYCYSISKARPTMREIAELVLAMMKNYPPDEWEWDGDIEIIEQALSEYPGLAEKIVFPKEHIWQSTNFPLMEHQVKELQKALMCNHRCNFSETGTGKTVMTTMTVYNKWIQEGMPPQPTLVICPNHLRVNWMREFRQFTDERADTTVIIGDKAQRKFRMFMGVTSETRNDDGTPKMHVIVAGYDTIVNDNAIFNRVNWYSTILDEAHRIKTPHSNGPKPVCKRTKMIYKLQDKSRHRYALTGTPHVNSFSDCYSIIEWVYPNYFGYRSKVEYEDYNFETGEIDRVTGLSMLGTGKKHLEYEYAKYGDRSKILGVRQDKMPQFQDLIEYASCRYRLSDIEKELPERRFITKYIKLSEQQKEAYKKIQKSLKWEMERADGTQKSMSVTCMLTQYLRLEQITSGFVKWDFEASYDFDNDRVIEELEVLEDFDVNPKLDACLELVKEAIIGNKAIVWCHFKHDIDNISEMLNLEKIPHLTIDGRTSDKKTQKHIDVFNSDPNIRVLVANPAACGEGLTLLGVRGTPARDYDDAVPTNTHVFFSKSWSFGHWVQSIARTFRIGTKCTQFVYSLLAENTIDEYIDSVVMRKNDVSRTILQDIVDSDIDQPTIERMSEREKQEVSEQHVKEFIETMKEVLGY